MTFYLSPPRGEIHMDRMLDLGLKRLELLGLIKGKCLLELQDTVLSDRRYLDLQEAVESNTPKDRVSHFALRLAAMKNYQFKQYFIAQEMHLFEIRNASLDPDEKLKSLKALRRHLRKSMRSGQMDQDALSEVQEFSFAIREMERLRSSVLFLVM